MNYRVVLGYVAGLSAFSAFLFAWDSAWELLTNSNKFDLTEMLSWLVVSVLVCAVSVLVMLVDAGLERVARSRG